MFRGYDVCGVGISPPFDIPGGTSGAVRSNIPVVRKLLINDSEALAVCSASDQRVTGRSAIQALTNELVWPLLKCTMYSRGSGSGQELFTILDKRQNSVEIHPRPETSMTRSLLDQNNAPDLPSRRVHRAESDFFVLLNFIDGLLNFS